jgi:hypothetical protein
MTLLFAAATLEFVMPVFIKYFIEKNCGILRDLKSLANMISQKLITQKS